jgi:hypothetical protein
LRGPACSGTIHTERDATELKLTHERLPTASKDSYDSGWTAVIKDLQSHLSTDSKDHSLASSRA